METKLFHQATQIIYLHHFFATFFKRVFTFSTTLSCEILDLTERRRYQRNELLKRQKIEKCKQEFIITEKGYFHPVSFHTKTNGVGNLNVSF